MNRNAVPPAFDLVGADVNGLESLEARVMLSQVASDGDDGIWRVSFL